MLKYSIFSIFHMNKVAFRNGFARMLKVLFILAFLFSPMGAKAAPVSDYESVLTSRPHLQAGGWFDSAWAFRRPVAISNSGSALTDYQVLVTLNASNFDFSNAAADGRDIRFVSQSGTALPFWIETWDSGTSFARIWVRIDSISTDGTTIYLYYGNTSASAAGSGTATFEFFDSDWTSLTSRWRINGGTPSVSDGVVSFASGATIQSLSSYASGHAMGYRAWFKTSDGYYKWGGFLNGVNAPYTYIGTVGEAGYPNISLTNNVTSRSAVNLGDLTASFHTYEIAWTSSVVRAFIDRAATPAGSLITQLPPLGATLPIQLGNYNDNLPGGETFDVDWVYLRSYQEPEPAGAVGSKEDNLSADLELSLTDSPDPVMVGSPLTYQITVTNHGPLNAADVVLTDALPASVALVSATDSQGVACTGTTTVSCELGSIASGGTAAVTIIVTPDTGGTIENTPAVTGSLTDYNLANNSATASTIVVDSTMADLSIAQTDSPDPVEVGSLLTYSITINNQGPANATGVVVTDTLPANVDFVSAVPDQGSCSQPGAVNCNLGTINSGNSANITITVTPRAAGSITNQVSVTGIEADPNLANNANSESTRVTAPSLGAVVLVNSNSANYADFQHFIKPYLDHFGVPYDVLNIATTPVEADIQDYALIIIGHRQIDVGSTCSGTLCLSASEQALITTAVNTAGSGLMNFDNDLSADGVNPRYQFVEDIFDFGYNSNPTGSGVVFPAAAWPHYITARHTSGETINTGSMTLAGITLPAEGTALATTSSAPFLAVRSSGAGKAVQWGTYDWMSHTVKGPIFGLDDLVWRSMGWAARKPFIFQGMPPFLTMRVDDESGPFDWIHVANEFGIKPWAGVFLSNIEEPEAADLSALVNAGKATTSIHAFNGAWFYWNQTDAQIAQNYITGTNWHTSHNIPISNYVLAHYYQLGTNAFAGLDNWDVECVGTHMDPGNAWGAPWVMNGPFRLFETGVSSGNRPQYYADYMNIPGYNNRFFNLVTEIRDDLGYEWYPNNNVADTIGHGTLQTKRALDSMALATLFTHDQYISGITMENWRSILQGITTNIAPYQPINVTMDFACQYAISKHNSKITSSSYDAANRQIAVNYTGTTKVDTKFYLFTEDQGTIQETWVDVPQFTDSTQVLFTLPGALDHIVVTPANATVVTGATQQFTALGYDAEDNPIPNLPFTWSIASGGGTINSSGLFTAGSTPGSYADTVVASIGAISDSASVTVTAPTLDHFTFTAIASPQFVNAPFQVTITARDASGNVFTGYSGTAALSTNTGTITPAATGNFSNGVWTGSVSINQAAESITITASAGAANGDSSSFAVQAIPALHHFMIQTIASPQTINSPFQITITAYDSSGNPLPAYTGTPVLSSSLGTITPSVTGAFSGSSWVGMVSLSEAGSDITITAADGDATGTSNSFNVQPPPPYYAVTSTQYTQATGMAFDVTVTAYQTTVDCSDDGHQYPVLTTTSDVPTLTSNTTNGLWTEFLYTPSRPFPSVMAGASYAGTLPMMRFYANGIPNGRYQVIANLYDVSSMRYFFGYTSADPHASYVDVPGSATGTQHREYVLGTVDITNNAFNLYVNDAQRLTGTNDNFGWAWVRLAPVVPVPPADITINLAEDSHQDPDLLPTQSVETLDANSALGHWTEFFYPQRGFPSIMASALHTPVTPTMHFSSTGIPNGDYEVFANLYNTNPLRYYYGFTSDDPQANYVETSGATDAGTQHLEYSLGTISIADGNFNLYVNRADMLAGADYDKFGWASIRLSPRNFSLENNMAIASSSPTMVFDGDGDGVFGEVGDNLKPLVNGSLTIAARDSSVGEPTISATDFLGQSGSNAYIIYSPTAVNIANFSGKAIRNTVQLEWLTAQETRLVGFNVYRSDSVDGHMQKQNQHLLKAKNSGQMYGASYQFTETVKSGRRYYYWLELVEYDGSEYTAPLVLLTDYLIFLPLTQD